MNKIHIISKQIVLLVFIFFIQPLIAQDPPVGADAEANIRALSVGSTVPVRTFNTAYEGLRGSAYLFKEWHSGDIFLTSGDTVRNIPLKLDTYNNHLVFQDPQNGDSVVINKAMVAKFQLKNKTTSNTFIKIPLVGEQGKIELKFAKLVYDGEVKIYRYHFKNLIKADYTGPYNANRPYDELTDAETLYIQKKNGHLHKIRTSRGAIIKALDDQKSKVKSYMKSNNVKGRNIDELIRIIKYYEAL